MTADRGQGEPAHERPAWKEFAWKLGSDVVRDHTFVIAASVAYFGFIAMFPTLIALVSLVGLFADPKVVERQVVQFADMMPEGATELITGQVHEIVQQNPDALGLGLVFSVVVSLWGASSGAAGLIKALNIAYEEEEERSFLHARGVALLLALGSMAAFLLMLGLMVVLPVLAGWLPGLEWLRSYVHWLRWLVLSALLTVGLALVYRYAPCRPLPRWRWISWGSSVATGIWLAASGLFSLYVRHAGGYQDTYGALGGVVVLLLWLYLSALAVLIGAEVDSTVQWMARKRQGEGAPLGETQALPDDAEDQPQHLPRSAQ